MRWIPLAVLLLALPTADAAPVPNHLMKGRAVDPSKIVGRWDLPRDKLKITYVFSKNGEVACTLKSELATYVDYGTYEITDETITYRLVIQGEKRVTTQPILVLTDTVLATKDRDGKIDRFVRLKD